jgi:hypothetical protein
MRGERAAFLIDVWVGSAFGGLNDEALKPYDILSLL